MTYGLQSTNQFQNQGGENMAKMTKEAAKRIQSATDKTKVDDGFKARAQSTVDKRTSKK